MVGNDVVDLDDEAIDRHHLRARFLDRVLCADERSALAASATPKVLLWSYFAAKEAAYKIVVKQTRGAPPPFAHRLFVVAPDLTTVRYEGATFSLQVAEHDGAVHAVATASGVPSIHACERGLSARAILCESIARAMGCSPNDLEVVRRPLPDSWDGFAPPVVTQKGERLPVDVSLSHDGRFAAFAWTPLERDTRN